MKKNNDKNNPGTAPARKPKGPKPVLVGAAAWPKADKYNGYSDTITRVHAPRK